MFVLQSFQIQVLYRTIVRFSLLQAPTVLNCVVGASCFQAVSSRFEIWITAIEFIFTTSLGFSALFCNTPPQSAYARLRGAGDDQEMMSSLLSEGDKTSSDIDGLNGDELAREIALEKTVGAAKGKSPEERAGFFSKLTFSWMNPLLELGVQRPLEEKDLYMLANSDTAKTLGNALEGNWNLLRRALTCVTCQYLFVFGPHFFARLCQCHLKMVPNLSVTLSLARDFFAIFLPFFCYFFCFFSLLFVFFAFFLFFFQIFLFIFF